jgi:diguanylate cyclase (GGDEF)-like protein
MMIDVDFFKMINDQYGHPVGDDVLIQIVSLIQTELRDSDILGRYGGEEFVVFLPHSNSQDSCEVAERIRLAVANAPFDAGDETLAVTISIGIKMMDESAQNMDTLVSCADKALYAAKQAGRNQVIDADQLLSDSL